MERYSLCDSEYRLMRLVWDRAPVASGALVKAGMEELGWKKSTTYTVLKKLEEKGLVKNENATVSVLVPRENVVADAAEGFVEKTFGGSLPGFLTAFMSGRKITDAEAEELRALIDAHREE